MGRVNTFIYKSFVKDVQRELDKDERRVLSRAGSIMTRETRKSIRAKGLQDTGNLLKGVKRDNYQHTVLVGMTYPAMHAIIVEYGSEDRYSKSGKFSGKMPAIPFFLPAYRVALPKMQAKLSEEW